MPFITQEKRKLVDMDFRFAEDKGDPCYVIYKGFVQAFRHERRWTTVHDLYKTRVIDTSWLFMFRTNDKYSREDMIAALHLAWQVFFAKEVLPYELEKEAVNGSI